MSKYALNSLLYRMKTDPTYLNRFLSERNRVLEEWDLSEKERDALHNWDMRELNRCGGYLHMLIGITNLLRGAHGRQEFEYDPARLKSDAKKQA